LVARIWTDVLHIAAVGRHDNFFELGGHSLLATQVVSRIQKATGVSLSLRQLFEEPTVARLAAAIEQGRRSNGRVSLPPIQPVARVAPVPLSFAQERMWFLQQLAPDNTAYHISLVIRLHGALDVPALECALQALTQRHESLRTIFPVKDGTPHQVILPEHKVSITMVDLTALAADEQEATAIDLVNADLAKAFDLAGAPAWRFTLLTCGPEDHVLYFAFHHIIFDQWSSAVLWQDLANYYHAFAQHRPPVVTPATIQYADYAIWQRSWLQGATLEQLLGYWQKQLAGVSVLELPLDKPRPPLQTFRGATEFLTLPPELAQTLRQVSSQMQVSPFMLFFATFSVLLTRYTGQEDIAMGVPVANRHHLDVEPLIGTLVNTLVIRTDLSGGPEFAELLQRVRNVLLDAYAHQDLPFEKLVSEVVAKRDLSYTPLVQVLFNMINTPFAYEHMADLPISLVQFDRGAAQFDLSVTVSIDENLPLEPQVAVEYNVELFEPETIRRMLTHYQTLLEAMAANPYQPIAYYAMLKADEIEQLTLAWNQTAMPYPQQRCLHDLVAAQAQKTPNKLAVTFGNSSVSYQTLDERSNQLAHYLQSMGVGPETVVGVYVERSLEMVVGLLGILKAGGAYLPLDPGFPEERLAFMVADADVHTILTSADLADQAPLTARGHLVCLDRDWPAIEQHAITLPTTGVQAHNLAYLIYTSGSTGKPKGVQIEHRNVVNFLTAMRQQPGLDADDVLLAITTLSFDISILEIFLPLVSGARVVIADRLTVVDGRELLRALRQHKVTVMQATPTTWSMLVEAGWHNTPTLRKALCGGEALSRPLADAILEQGIALWNMYGPTETTIWSAVWPVHPGTSQVPIGRPIGNNQLYILDALGSPTPIGVAGELFIGGDGVARGYRNRPELNEERFVADPFVRSGAGHARMYRTGDAARYRADGIVEYLGRLDFQVKVNGHRIELGEVETHIAAHEAVQEAVVTVHENAMGEQQLVAHIVQQQHVTEAPTTTEWRNYLRRHLPNYMVPAHFLYLEAFPLTPNRKIDRKALPAPDVFRPELKNQYVAPRNDLELLLANLLAELLELEKVGVLDDFFELGGHSLQATRYVARVGNALRMDLPLWAFLRAPSVATLAEHLLALPDAGARIMRIAQLQIKMASLSDDDVQALLQAKRQAQ
ncbi:MAG TPA: amino acid adenylation domain-containing protein, partial [Caldilineaceae bacterium]|nr:amino acid adenylation domain-containing protein [Caldilineaceae bacterium]